MKRQHQQNSLHMPCSSRFRSQGFTLVELAIVISIIALILVAVISGRSLIGVSHSQAVQVAVKELAEAIAQFRARYSYLPGDMPNATTLIPGVAGCSLATNGNGDGQIDPTVSGDPGEAGCVNSHLFNSGFIKGGPGAIVVLSSDRRITIRAVGRAFSAITTFPSSTRNVIEIWNVPCQIAQDFDNKTDDGDFAKGNTRATVASCVVGGTNDPVPTMAIGI